VNGLWLTGFKVTGDAAQISMSGGVLVPELLPTYIQRLGREQVMQGKTFSTLQMQQAKVAVGAGLAPARAPEPVRYVEFTMYSTTDADAKNAEARNTGVKK